MKRLGSVLVLPACSAFFVLLATPACTLRQYESAPEMISNFSEAKPLAGQTELRLNLHFRVGHITLSQAPTDTLYNLDVDYDATRYKPTVQYEPRSSSLDIRIGGINDYSHVVDKIQLGIADSMNPLKTKNRLNLLVSPKVKLQLRIFAGVGKANIDLTSLQLSALHIESGVGSTFLSCEKPNALPCEQIRIRAGVGEFEAIQLGNLNFRSLDFEGGIGSTRLDFSGQWTKDAAASLKVGIGELSMLLPPYLGAEVNAEKKFLSGLHLESFTQYGASYYSQNYETAKQRLRLHLHTGIGSIRVKWL